MTVLVGAMGTYLHAIARGALTTQEYYDEAFTPDCWTIASAVGGDFLLMQDNSGFIMQEFAYTTKKVV